MFELTGECGHGGFSGPYGDEEEQEMQTKSFADVENPGRKRRAERFRGFRDEGED